MNVCGLDVGTSGVKAVVFDEKGAGIANAYRAYETQIDLDGKRGLDAHQLWEKTKEALACVCAQTNGDIAAIAVASFGEAFVLLDEHDRVLHDIMIYTDRRGEKEFLREAEKTSQEEVACICGLPFSPTYSVSKLLYLKECRPKLYNRAKKVLFIEDYVGYLLNGERAVDYSVASRSMLLDAKNCCWSSIMMNQFGIEKALFSQTVAAGTVIGTIKKEIAQELGASASMKIVAGIHDQPASAIGAGLREGSVACSMGTSECMTPVFSGMFPVKVTARQGLCSEPVWEKGKYCTLAYNPSSGLLIEWFFKTFAAAETRQHGAPYALFEEHFPPQPTKIMIQPYLAGSGTPYLDYLARLGIAGIGLGTTRFDLYRAMLEGLALDQCLNLETITRQGVAAQSLMCVGGGSRSRPWLQVKADVMQIPVSTLDCGEAGALGCAVLCAVAMGVYASVEEAAQNMSRVKEILEPNQENREFYREKFEQYRLLHAHLMEESEYACR